MPLLTRLLLCLTLLANLAGGAWAMPAAGAHAAGGPAPVAGAACHDPDGQATAMSMPAHDHASPASAHDQAPADPGCCQHAGCDCVQHGGTAFGLPVAMTGDAPRHPEPATGPAALRGLPRPYQPVRPPIA